MTKGRFLNILGNMHLVNNAEESDDCLCKVQGFTNMLKINFETYMYYPEEHLLIDEGTCPFKGRVGYITQQSPVSETLSNMCERSSFMMALKDAP